MSVICSFFYPEKNKLKIVISDMSNMACPTPLPLVLRSLSGLSNKSIVPQKRLGT